MRKDTKPKLEDTIVYDGDEYRVVTLLSKQFVAECLTTERSHQFIFYTDDWRTA